MTDEAKEPVTLPSVENTIQVRFSDTDAMGHISSGSYAAFAEVGRAAFFMKIPEPESEIEFNLGVAALDAFVARYPDHKLAGQAQLDMAESYLQHDRYDDAIARLNGLLGN